MKKISWIIAFLFLPFFSEASLQVSGYINVKSLGGYTYQATIVDYTISNACDTAYADRDTIRLYWGDGTSSLLSRSNGNGDSVCDCRTMNTYMGTHTFDGPGSYHIWFEAAPRDADIANMTASINQDMVIFHVININPVISNGVSLPVIANGPICSYGCTTQCYHFNLNASASGTDSISYSMGNCLSSGGVSAGYHNPGATINPLTGELSWCNPPSDGLWSFAIIITTFDSVTISGHRIQIPIDTEEVELQVNVQNNCSLGVGKMTPGDESITIFPNPSTGIFTIQSSVVGSNPDSYRGSVDVYNMLGEKVYFQSIVNISSFIVNLSNQYNGVYLYRVISENGNLIGEGKVIVQR